MVEMQFSKEMNPVSAGQSGLFNLLDSRFQKWDIWVTRGA